MGPRFRGSGRNVAVLLAACLGAAGALGGTAPALASQSSASQSSASQSSTARASGWPAISAGTFFAAVTSAQGRLNGVFCTSASNCWAVGATRHQLFDRDQALHWNGRTWTQVATPKLGADSELTAVRCLTASNCWAVGEYMKAGAQLDQILHWTGRKWLAVPTPTPGGTLPGDENLLSDVSCVSAGNCWAAGTYGNTIQTPNKETQLALNQALHWNGRKWSLTATPQPGGTARNDVSSLNAVRCTSAQDCWAGGTYGKLRRINKSTLTSELLHWNGKAWIKVIVPSPGGTVNGSFTQLNGLSCTSPSNCWAVGEAGRFGKNTERFLNLALHWNGKRWFRIGTPNPAGVKADSLNSLASVTCLSADNCWTLGTLQGVRLHAFELIEILHWNGTRWIQVTAPHPAGTKSGDSQFLSSVRCVTSTNCWAVGLSQQDSNLAKDVIVHWNGSRWSIS